MKRGWLLAVVVWCSAFEVMAAPPACGVLKGSRVSVAEIGLPTRGALVKSAKWVQLHGREFCKVLGEVHSIDPNADPKNDESHDIVYGASRFPVSRDLHEGLGVKGTTNFDGARYVASAITLE